MRAGSASIVYITFGGIQWDYATVMIVTGFAVTVCGQLFTYRVMETCGRRSVIVAAMAALLTIGAAIMVYEVLPALRRAHEQGFFHTTPICK